MPRISLKEAVQIAVEAAKEDAGGSGWRHRVLSSKLQQVGGVLVYRISLVLSRWRTTFLVFGAQEEEAYQVDVDAETGEVVGVERRQGEGREEEEEVIKGPPSRDASPSSEGKKVVSTSRTECPYCGNSGAVTLIWSDGNVEVTCPACRRRYRV